MDEHSDLADATLRATEEQDDPDSAGRNLLKRS
jgi:hypothetical protein